MSRRALNWAMKQRAGSSPRKLVLIALAQLADDAGAVTCGNAAIAEICEVTPEAVRQHLSKLEEAGLLTRAAQFATDGARLKSRIALACQPVKRCRKTVAPRDRLSCGYAIGWRDRETGAEGRGVATFDRQTVERMCCAENAADPRFEHFPIGGAP